MGEAVKVSWKHSAMQPSLQGEPLHAALNITCNERGLAQLSFYISPPFLKQNYTGAAGTGVPWLKVDPSYTGITVRFNGSQHLCKIISTEGHLHENRVVLSE